MIRANRARGSATARATMLLLAASTPAALVAGVPRGDCAAHLLAATHQGGQSAPSTLVELDPATGAVLQTIGAIGFGGVGALDFHPLTGVLYGVGRRPADGTAVLIAIDSISGAGTEIGPLVGTPFGAGLMDLSIRNADGVPFMTALGSSCISVYTIDLGSGLATELGDTGTCAPGNALAFDATDELVHLDQDDLPLGGNGTQHVVDQASAASIPVHPLGYAGFPPLDNPRPNAMEFHPTSGGGYVAVNDGSGGQGPNYLATIDTATGTVSHLGRTADGLDALAWRLGEGGGVCCPVPAPDTDADGLCDPIDPCPEHPNPGGGPALFGYEVIALDPTHFGWDASTSYLAAGGDFVQPTDIRPYAFTFFVSGAGSEFLDATSPPSGVGSWYLWSADCPQHSWSSGGAGECATGEGSPGCIPGGRDGALP